MGRMLSRPTSRFFVRPTLGAAEACQLAVAPTFPHAPPLARPRLEGSKHEGTFGTIRMMIRGELASGHESSRHNLVFGRSVGT
jgi:hypothetical protein